MIFAATAIGTLVAAVASEPESKLEELRRRTHTDAFPIAEFSDGVLMTARPHRLWQGATPFSEHPESLLLIDYYNQWGAVTFTGRVEGGRLVGRDIPEGRFALLLSKLLPGPQGTYFYRKFNAPVPRNVFIGNQGYTLEDIAVMDTKAAWKELIHGAGSRLFGPGEQWRSHRIERRGNKPNWKALGSRRQSTLEHPVALLERNGLLGDPGPALRELMSKPGVRPVWVNRALLPTALQRAMGSSGWPLVGPPESFAPFMGYKKLPS